MLHKRLSPAAWLGLALLPVVLLAVAASLPHQPLLGLGRVGFYLALGLTMIIGLGCAAMHWKALDEAGRAAHRYAWYWGGSFALGLAVILSALVIRLPSLTAWFEHWIASLIHHNTSAVGLAFMLGATFAALIQVIGYILMWFAWWGARRGAG